MSIKLNADEVKADLEKRARERAERAERMRLAEEEKNRVPAPPTTPNKKESLHRRFRSLRDTLGEDHPDTLKVKVQLHERHLSRKTPEEDPEEYVKAITEIRDMVKAMKAKENIGPAHEDVFEMQATLCLLYYKCGAKIEALEVLRDVLREQIDHIGDNDLRTMRTKAQMGLILKDTQRWEEAETMYSEAIEGMEGLLGLRHPDSLVARSSLALVLRAQNKLDEAAEQLGIVVEAREKALGPNNPATLRSRVNLLHARLQAGKVPPDQVKSEWQSLFESQSKAMGVDHVEVLVTRNNLANALLSAGQTKKAYTHHKSIMDLRARKLGKDHDSTLLSMHNVACCACLIGEMEYALRTLQQCSQLGYTDVDSIRKDPDLGMLRDTMPDEIQVIIRKVEHNRRKAESPAVDTGMFTNSTSPGAPSTSATRDSGRRHSRIVS